MRNGKNNLPKALRQIFFTFKVLTGFVSALPLWIAGAGPAGKSEGRVGNAKPTNSTAGEQLLGIGTLAVPVRQKATGQLSV